MIIVFLQHYLVLHASLTKNVYQNQYLPSQAHSVPEDKHPWLNRLVLTHRDLSDCGSSSVCHYLISINSVILGQANQHFIKCQSSKCHVNAALIFGIHKTFDELQVIFYDASPKVRSAESVLLHQETFDWFYPVHLDGIQCCPS